MDLKGREFIKGLYVYEIEGKEWFIGKNIAEVLSYRDSSKIKERITHIQEDTLKYTINTQGGNQLVNMVSLKGFSEVIQRTRKIDKKLKQELLTSLGLSIVTFKETEFGALLQEALFELDIEVIPQYKVDNYKIDFYLPKYNMAIEYDEQQHFTETNMKLDNCRQAYIENKIGAEFIRLDYRDSDIKNVMRVIKAVM